MKRILAFFLSILLLSTLLCVPAYAVGEKLLAITYDDGPGAHTARLLDGLKARGAQATFFMVGQSAARNPDLVKRVYQEGHQVANHSYNHSQLTSLSIQGVRNQIQNTNAVLDQACGAGSTYMVRAPYGSTNAAVRQAVGAPLAFWSVDTLDWKNRNATTVKNAVVNGAKDGGIILVHDIHPTTVDGTLAAIDVLKGQGYQFVTVQELFRRRGVALENGVQYTSCPPNGTDLGPVQAPSVTVEPAGDKLRVTLSAQEGAAIYYSTDGSPLNQASARYGEPLLVSPPCSLRAVAAFNMNGSRSEVVTQDFTMPITQAPTASLQDGRVALDCQTPGASISYTLSGAQASDGAQAYTAPMELTPGTTVTAWASASGCLDSAQVQYTYSQLKNLFADVHPQQWYYSAIDRAAAAGYLQGGQGCQFQPDAPITRAQLVTILYRATAEIPDGTQLPFPDVPDTAYYFGPVLWAWESGLVRGYEDGGFHPDQPVSRQELALIFYRYLLHCDVLLSKGDISGFQDADAIPAWAAQAVGELSASGLLQGDAKGNFAPTAVASRAQAALLLLRCVDYITLDRLPMPQELRQ